MAAVKRIHTPTNINTTTTTKEKASFGSPFLSNDFNQARRIDTVCVVYSNCVGGDYLQLQETLGAAQATPETAKAKILDKL
jgi:hypothetical protein